MIACKHFLKDYQCGTTMTEVVLAISVVLAVSPFMYNQIRDMAHESQDIAKANEIVSLRDDVINYIRVNQNQWGDVAEIKLSDSDLEKIAPIAHAGYIDKYQVNGTTINDVYLAFDIDNTDYRIANIARQIGEDAAIVREDGVAYSQSWAVSAPMDFFVGDLIFRINRDFDAADKSKFLHRATMGEDNLNQMQRDLHMNNFNVFNVGNIDATSAKITDVDAVFLESDIVDADTVYFSSGANLSSDNVTFSTMRVTGDTNGFKSIVAEVLNGNKYITNGRIITDRATIGKSVNVAGNLNLKSSTTTSITGFSGISMNKLLTPYLFATDLVFFENFGITVSSELLLTGGAPLKIGDWVFPSLTPPSFSKLILTRASVPNTPDAYEFKNIISKDWQNK